MMDYKKKGKGLDLTVEDMVKPLVERGNSVRDGALSALLKKRK